MKHLFIIILAICQVFVSYAQDCDIPITICLTKQTEQLPAASQQLLINSLKRVATQAGLIADVSATQFFLTVKFDVLDKDIVPSTPAVELQDVGVTLYLGDMYDEKIFSTAYFEIKCAGTNDTKMWNDALKRLSGNAPQIKQMVAEGKQAIVNWYDANYKTVLKRAESLMAYHNYKEAVLQAMSVPPCSKGYNEASKFGLKAFKQYVNNEGINLLTTAKAIWAAGQTQEAGGEAMAYLLMIDPSSASYPEALQLMKEVQTQVRSDIDLENRDKYEDAIELERLRIDALRQIGVAWGKGQQPSTTYLNWIR